MLLVALTYNTSIYLVTFYAITKRLKAKQV